MARYTGPKAKKARRFNEAIFGPCKALKKKAYPPGQHGRGRRKKQSEYAVQLLEKQKTRYTYGVLEKQFRNLFKRAAKKEGVTGTNMLQLLESRLDNTVFRFGLTSTRRAARQLVSHKHIMVNGIITNIPSFTVKPGDVVSIASKSKDATFIKENIAGRQHSRFSWLEWDTTQMQGKMITMPERDEIPENIKEQLIVELYSK